MNRASASSERFSQFKMSSLGIDYNYKGLIMIIIVNIIIILYTRKFLRRFIFTNFPNFAQS